MKIKKQINENESRNKNNKGVKNEKQKINGHQFFLTQLKQKKRERKDDITPNHERKANIHLYASIPQPIHHLHT